MCPLLELVSPDKPPARWPEQSPLLHIRRSSSSGTPEQCWPSCPASSCPRPARPPPLHRTPHSPASTAGRELPGIDLCGTSPPPCSARLLSHSGELRPSPARRLVRPESSIPPVRLPRGSAPLLRFQ